MTSGMPELGSKISLISKADIRYEGRLFTVDPQECTIALASGKFSLCYLRQIFRAGNAYLIVHFARDSFLWLEKHLICNCCAPVFAISTMFQLDFNILSVTQLNIRICYFN